MTDNFDGVQNTPGASRQCDRNLLAELSRATTAYHEAAPEFLEIAREEYVRAVISFNSATVQTVSVHSTSKTR